MREGKGNEGDMGQEDLVMLESEESPGEIADIPHGDSLIARRCEQQLILVRIESDCVDFALLFYHSSIHS